MANSQAKTDQTPDRATRILKRWVLDNKYIPLRPTERQAQFLVDMRKNGMFGGAAGGGKGQPLDGKVVTPYGFRDMGDIEQGDRICSPTHGNTKVIDTVSLGQRQLYEVAFSDGTSLEVTSDHVWKIKRLRKGEDKKGLQYTLRTTEQINDYLSSGYYDLGVPVSDPVQFTKAFHPGHVNNDIHPYVLGYLLGDNSFRCGEYNQATFSTGDYSLVEKLKQHSKVSVHDTKRDAITGVVKNTNGALKEMGLWNEKSENKFVPNNYLWSSIDDRFELLRGLMDSDGTVDERGHVGFCSASEDLVSDVAFLARSLGYRVTKSDAQKASYTDSDGERVRGLDKYRLYIQGNGKEDIFHLDRKKERCSNPRWDKTHKKIESVTPTRTAEAKCIKVDNPNGLYIAGEDMIVTHNSVSQIMAALMFAQFPDYHAILFRRTYPQLSKPDSLIPMSKEMLKPTPAEWNQKQSRWTFPSGATLTFSHMQYEDDKYDHKSAQYQYVGFDEASEFTRTQLTYLFSRLRKSTDNRVPLRFRLTTNPGGPSHDYIKENYVESREDDTFYLPAQLEHNPHIDTEEYEQNLAKLAPIEQRRLRSGDWDVQAEGELFKRHWFEVVDEIPDIKKAVRYWDFAGTEGAGNYTAGVLIGKREDATEYYVLDVQRLQLDPGERDQMIVQTAKLDTEKDWYPDPDIGFEQEGGSAGKKQCLDLMNQLAGHTTFKDNPTGSKQDRAGPLASQANLGNVYVVNDDWTDDYITELVMFPEGDYDDQVDASSGAFSRLHIDEQDKQTVGTIF